MKYWLLAAVLLVGIGCGSKNTVNTPEGKTTVEENGNKTNMTVETDKGKVNAEVNKDDGSTKWTSENEKGEKTSAEVGKSVQASELGVTLYPGSSASKNHTQDMKVEDANRTTIALEFTTPDKPDKVAEFYKKALVKADSMPMEDMFMVNGRSQSGDDVVITVKTNKESHLTEYVISVVKNKKK